MLPKTKRADKKTIDRIFSGGKFINSPTLNFKYILAGTGPARVSFIAPKSVAKLAVERNRLRRRGYNALKNSLAGLPPGFCGVFIFKKYENDNGKIEKDIETILSKIAGKNN